MSRSSELHSYLAEEAIESAKQFHHHLDYVTGLFEELDAIECIERVASAGYFHCQFGFTDRELAEQVQNTLRDQHFLADIVPGNMLYVSWEPEELAELHV